MRNNSLTTVATLLVAGAFAVVPADVSAQRGGRQGGQGGEREDAQAGPKPYAEVVTEDARTRDGMFKVHRIDEKLLFEIPRDQLNRDILLVKEIAQTALGIGYGGQAVGNSVFRFERRGNKLLLRGVSYEAVADPNTPEYLAVRNANVDPIIAALDVAAYGPDSTMVVDVTRTFTQPPTELGPGTRVPGNIDADRSWVERATPFPDNVNVYSTLTYSQNPNGGRGAATPPGGRGGGNSNPSNTVVMSWSFHRLPDEPMMPRLCDDRVGYFSVRFTDFTDEEQQVDESCYITRYRLEKKNPNAAVSDPVEPIVYYLDPATPTKWIPYFIEAIESWQPAFEAAGFSNAIIGRVAPDDPDWSPEDARYSVVRWLPSTVENASGPHVHDPRSGEILNAHIQFYQNVQRLQLTWYFTQAAALDPRARKFPYPDDLMGKLLGYVMAHEVGHTLGFQHNMKASSLYPTDSLRNASFVRRMSHTPTLMDYSRFNYIAQPEDNIPVDLLIPQIGPYDKWATMWGYKPIPGAESPDAERATLDEWAREQDTKPYLRFSTSGSSGTDPGELTEAVGDYDAVKATRWGIANLKRGMQWVLPATLKPTEGWDDLDNLYGRMIGQWRTELNHVNAIVGGYSSQEKYGSQNGARFDPISRARQKEAVAFLNEQAFQTPSFFLDREILGRLSPGGEVARIVSAQTSLLNSLLSNTRLIRLSEIEASSPSAAYPVLELLSDVRGGIFGELSSNADITVYRRALQRAYVELLDNKLNPPPPPEGATGRAGRGGGPPALDTELSDVYPAVRAELTALGQAVEAAIPGATGMKRAHLEDLRHRIHKSLNGDEEV
jgi:hypothetical protein